MAVSKRLRFEILRRDNHTCRYCGENAPGVKLVIDHVLPEALGGRSEPENLVAACEPCNNGKASIAPDAPTVRAARADAMRWSRALATVTDARRQAHHERLAYGDLFSELWEAWRWGGDEGNPFPLPDTWRESVEKFHDLGLPYEDMERAISKAMARKVSIDGTFKYFCGTCWGMLRDIREAASDVFMADLDDEVYGLFDGGA